MGTFIIKKTPTGFNFSLLAANKEKIAVASGVYSSKSAAKVGMKSIATNAVKCVEENRIDDLTLQKKEEPKKFPKFEIYYDKAGLFRYRLYAANGESIAMSEEGYKTKGGCLGGIKSVAKNAPDAEIVDETLDK